MTLIAFATYGDHAQILTDTLAYDGGVRHLGNTSKVLPMPHVEAALMTQGSSEFGLFADHGIPRLAFDAPTFDALAKAAPAELRAAWAHVRKHDGIEGTAFLVGWSEEAQAFTAYGFAAEHDFEPWRIEGTFMIPTPFVFRPSGLELDRLRAEGFMEEEIAAEWAAAPAVPAPEDADDWIFLGQFAWRQRAACRGPKVIIGGHLHLTTLERGKVTTETVHTFDTTGDEFRLMVSNTLHPLAQAAPCGCGSGAPFMDCHLDRDLACPCGSGKTVGECCILTAEERAAVA